MTWFRIDDGFADHPKVAQCSLAAIGLWTRAGAWCSKHLTNGQVPRHMLRSWGATAKLADELVRAAGARAPAGLQFWLQHLGPGDAAVLTLHRIWTEMPRVEWLLWFAAELGFGVHARKAAARAAADVVPALHYGSPRPCNARQANAARRHIGYGMLMLAMRRREIAAAEAARAVDEALQVSA